MADLVEAEVHEIRRVLVRTGWSLSFLVVMSLLVAVGVGFCLWGMYLFLLERTGAIEAALLCGITTLIVAGGFAWLAIRLNR